MRKTINQEYHKKRLSSKSYIKINLQIRNNNNLFNLIFFQFFFFFFLYQGPRKEGKEIVTGSENEMT